MTGGGVVTTTCRRRMALMCQLIESFYPPPTVMNVRAKDRQRRCTIASRCLSSSSSHDSDPPAVLTHNPALRDNNDATAVLKSSQQQQRHLRRRLDVAIVGLPNSGKSQLLNALTGATVSAVSRKRHTTRNGILGVKTVENSDDNTQTQLLFVDTPGFLRTNDAKVEGLGRDLMVSARSEMVNVDYTVIVVDAAKRLTRNVQETLVELMFQAMQAQGRIEDDDTDEDEDINSDDEEDDNNINEKIIQHQQQQRQQKFAVVLNKVDLVHPKSNLIELAMEIGSHAYECIKYDQYPESNDNNSNNDDNDTLVATGVPEQQPQQPRDDLVLPKLDDNNNKDDVQILDRMPTFFYTSAIKNEGVDDLLQFLIQKATPASAAFEAEPGQTTTMQPQERVEEIIREKLYRCLHKEVPHQIRQQNRLFQMSTKTPSILSVQQDIIVQTKSHQELVHGRNSQTLERIRESAQRDLAKAFGCNVNLHLHVKLAKSKQRPWSID